MHRYSPSTDKFYAPGIHSQIPVDAIDVEESEVSRLLAGRAAGKRIVLVSPGQLDLEDVPKTATELCSMVDAAADRARKAVAGDPLRAVEYDRAATAALAFATAGYQGVVPPMVAAWAINGRTAQQAADDILREAAQYSGALVQLRATRLQAKELIRAAMAAGNVEQAQDIADETIASIEATVAGIGNNA